MRDYGVSVVCAQPSIAARLTGLHGALSELVNYEGTRRPASSGPIRTIEIEGGGSTADVELPRELLSRALLGGFGGGRQGPELLVVVGADALAPEVLAALTGAAQRPDRCLVPLFTRITDEAERTIGHGGQDCVVFLRLPNHNDARIAAEYLGREFTFVVNGVSLADGETDQWNESRSRSSGRSSGWSSTSGSSTGYADGALSFGRSFGSSVSTSFTSGLAETSTSGGSRSTTRTTSFGRVHDYVLQPEQFQHLPESAMLVAMGNRVVLADCDPRIAAEPRTALTPLVGP